MNTAPTGATMDEARAFLARHPDVEGIDIVLTDLHGIGRGKIIRRHELEALFAEGRGMPASLFAQDIHGDDVEGALATFSDKGGDSRCWPVPGTLGLQPLSGRGLVLLQLFDSAGRPIRHDPRSALMRQVDRATAAGFVPMGAFELEFYLINASPGVGGERALPVRALLGGRPLASNNCMSVDELDEMSPFFDAVYAAAKTFDLTLEAMISEYAEGQFELTLRYRDLARAADDLILTKALIRTTARRFGMTACFMAKPFGDRSGSGMHMHLSLADTDGANLFADTSDGELSPLMLQAMGGIRGAMAETMLILAPGLNSWRRFASNSYSPAQNSWGIEDRGVALRIPGSSPEARHFEHRIAGVDANPYLVATAALGTALDGIDAGADVGPAGPEGAASAPLPPDWQSAIEVFAASGTMLDVFGAPLRDAFAEVKRAEYARLASLVTDVEWSIYGNSL